MKITLASTGDSVDSVRNEPTTSTSLILPVPREDIVSGKRILSGVLNVKIIFTKYTSVFSASRIH